MHDECPSHPDLWGPLQGRGVQAETREQSPAEKCGGPRCPPFSIRLCSTWRSTGTPAHTFFWGRRRSLLPGPQLRDPRTLSLPVSFRSCTSAWGVELKTAQMSQRIRAVGCCGDCGPPASEQDMPPWHLAEWRSTHQTRIPPPETPSARALPPGHSACSRSPVLH